MDSPRLIAQLCARFGVTQDFGRRLQPLVERALAAEPGKQRLLLELVERSFAEEARRLVRERPGGVDWRALTTVASLLHSWEPPAWFERWDRPIELS